jgi:hypothetical protein
LFMCFNQAHELLEFFLSPYQDRFPLPMLRSVSAASKYLEVESVEARNLLIAKGQGRK